MKLTLDSKSFVEAVVWATKSFDQKDNAAYVALQVTKDGAGSLFHMNPTSFMKSPFLVLDSEIEASSMNDGVFSLALEARYLQRLSSALSSASGALELSKDMDKANAPLKLKSSNGSFTLPMIDTTVGEEPELITLGEVDDREYFDALQRLGKLCDPANAGFIPVLGAVDIKLDVDNEKVVIMATDRYALGEITTSFEPSEEAGAYVEDTPNVLLPVEDATLIAPSKGLTSSTTLVHETKGNKFGYIFSDERVALFSLKNADPLAYHNVKEKAAKEVSNSIVVDLGELKKAISNVSNLAWDETTITFVISEDQLIVSDEKSSNKVSVELDEVEIDQEYTVKFVRSIINEAFSPVSTSKIKINWKNETSSFVLESILDDGSVAENVFVFVVTSHN